MDLSARAKRPKVVEHRAVPFRDVELRAKSGAGTTLSFTGYACVTEQGYEMEDWLGPYTEVVRAGAFRKTLSEAADVPFLVNHSGLTLARTKSGTMRLSEDDTGLYVDADLDPASPHVEALRSAMDRGDVDEMSFGFWVTRQQWSPDYDQRDILEVNLNRGDVSVVNYAANPATAGAQLNSRQVVAALREVRAGTTLTPEAMDTLGQILRLSATDGVVDVAQPLLAEVLGAPNPDGDPDMDEPNDPAEPAGDQQNNGLSNLYDYRARLLAL